MRDNHPYNHSNEKGGSPLNADRQFGNRRNRTLVGMAVVAISLAIAVALAGFSFAAGNTAANGQYPPKKITVCHHTKSLKNPVVTITISQSAWPAFQRTHPRDTLGACTKAQIKKAKAAAHKKLLKLKAQAAKKHGKTKVVVVVTTQTNNGKGHGKGK